MKKILIVVFAVAALVALYIRRRKEDEEAAGTGDFPNPGKYLHDRDELNRENMYAGS